MKLQRTKAPASKEIKRLSFEKAKKQILKNGIELYSITVGEQEILKIDFMFAAGEWYQTTPLVSASTIQLLQEGSALYSADSIAEQLDFMGSYIYFNASKHTATITVYTLVKYFEETIKILEDVIKNPQFPEEKFRTYVAKKQQLYTLEREKVEVMAQKKFVQVVFGTQHPYGISHEPEEFLNLTVSQLKKFHAHFYNSNNCKIVMSGKIKSEQHEIITRYFGDAAWNVHKSVITLPDYVIEPSEQKSHFVEKADAVQSAVRVGKLLVNKYNPDYSTLQVLNTILGGYFGSRLMSNIREDKGYTYGIGSGIVSHKTAGYFVIVSQVGSNVCKQALNEIYYELKRLRTETIPDAEIQTVKNYMKAAIARNFDGPFALSESFKTILEYDLGYKYYMQFWKKIDKISASELKYLANTYLNEDSMYEVIAGGNP
ncbi:MAG TPA: pitrilysin family protein [Bacteroidales bacterium]|nr:pitrilysin family protein [Bacteroidales bacterium]